jgi:hypothetical protein
MSATVKPKQIIEEDLPTLYEHKWLFVIIPMTLPDTDFPKDPEALLAAYCKHCDAYYTKTLLWLRSSAYEGYAGLPRWGCIGPEGRF